MKSNIHELNWLQQKEIWEHSDDYIGCKYFLSIEDDDDCDDDDDDDYASMENDLCESSESKTNCFCENTTNNELRQDLSPNNHDRSAFHFMDEYLKSHQDSNSDTPVIKCSYLNYSDKESPPTKIKHDRDERKNIFPPKSLFESRKLAANPISKPCPRKDRRMREPFINPSCYPIQKQRRKEGLPFPCCTIPSPSVAKIPSPMLAKGNTNANKILDQEYYFQMNHHQDQLMNDEEERGNITQNVWNDGSIKGWKKNNVEKKIGTIATTDYPMYDDITDPNEIQDKQHPERKSHLVGTYPNSLQQSYTNKVPNVPIHNNVTFPSIPRNPNTISPKKANFLRARNKSDKVKVKYVIPANKKVRYTHLEPGSKLMPKEENGEPFVYSNTYRVYNSELGKKKKTALWLQPMLAEGSHSTVRSNDVHVAGGKK